MILRRWVAGWLWTSVLGAVLAGGCVDVEPPAVEVYRIDGGAPGRTPLEHGRDAGGVDLAIEAPDDDASVPLPDRGADAQADRAESAGPPPMDGPPAPDAPVVAPPLGSCSVLFQDDFESGNLDGWDKLYSIAPTIAATAPIAGLASLSVRLGSENAVGRTFAARRKVRLALVVDLASISTQGSIPSLGALRSSRLGYSPVTFYFGRGSSGPVISVRAYTSSQNFERISFARLPASQITLRIEWEAATASSSGSARLFVDGAAFWTSPPLPNLGADVDELRLGNTARAGSGNLLYDGVLLETCE
jgi:hypothetical protein